MSPSCWLWRSVAVLGAAMLLAPVSASPIISLRELRDQAQAHERNAEWDKALAIYAGLLRDQRGAELQNRYQHCLRRYWQGVRHQDESYRKEVLGLDYGQALRLYNKIRDTLLDTTLGKRKLDPAQLLQKGMDELDAALAHPIFCQVQIPGKQAEIQAFREFLKRNFTTRASMTRAQVERQIRNIALAAQDMLQLNPTVTILELACGASYAIDNYTAYLTPQQFHDLFESLKGETTDGMMVVSVHAELKTSGIGYIRILGFQDTTLQDLDDALKKLSDAGVKGLILDLRGNPGGLVEVAIECAKRFLAAGVIATVENQDPKFSTIYHARNAAPFALPMTVLIDGDTASAAEVLAVALKENERARLVGQPTFGKNCTQSLVKLPAAANGAPTGGLRVTVARFFSPKGNSYSGRGIAPDVLVAPFKPDSLDGEDHQLVAALTDLRRQFGMSR